jgi:hypothetical protein
MLAQPASWPVRRFAWWALAAVIAVLWQGRGLLRDLRPPSDIVVDFYQEWASARNLLRGESIYEPQRASAVRYLGCTPRGEAPFFIEVNAHPPTAVLLGLPLAGLPYPDAVLVWNLISLAALLSALWLIGHELGLSVRPWTALAGIVLLIMSWPVRSHFQQGQLAMLLLLLVTVAWIAERSGRAGLAGLFLGTATALKIFPALLFLPFIFRRQWRVVGAGLVCIGLLTVATMAVLGPGAYLAYFHEVPPIVAEWRSAWNNASLPGFWCKLFEPGGKGSGVIPLVSSPLLARGFIVASCATVIALLGRHAMRAQTRIQCDQSFAATVVGMLLLTPVTWEHSFLLLLLPMAIFWADSPAASMQRRVLVVLSVVLLVNPAIFYPFCRIEGLSPTSRVFCSAPQVLVVLSVQCYALVSLLATVLWHGRAAREAIARPPAPPVEYAKRRAA